MLTQSAQGCARPEGNLWKEWEIELEGGEHKQKKKKKRETEEPNYSW